MKPVPARCVTRTVFALALAPILFGGPASAQYERRPVETEPYESRQNDSGGLFGGLFGRGERAQREAPYQQQRQGQVPPSELVVRLDRIENQIRQLTGTIEQLQFRNQQLEQQVRRQQEDMEYRLQEMGGKAPPAQRRPQPMAQQPVAQPAPPPQAPAPAPGRRSDAFDPNENPSAPGAPQQMGSIPARAAGGPPPIIEADPPVGAQGGRDSDAPLDLGTMAERTTSDAPPPASATPRNIPGPLPAPPPRNPSATGGRSQLASAPTATPRDEFALAQGYVQRRDYALAEQSLREFLKKYPTDRLVPEAHYWLGESLFQRQQFRDAAESFLTVSTKYERSGKAPDSLLRLGQSLAALGEREAACATLGEVVRKFPKASASLKQSVQREQQRARC